MIKIVMGGRGVRGNSEGCLEVVWWVVGVIKRSLLKLLKSGVSKDRN